MDCYKILELLTKFDKAASNVVTDRQLLEILNIVRTSIPKEALKEIVEDKNVISNVNDTSWQYLHLILYTIKRLCKTELAQENPLFTVDQFKSIKLAIEIAACIGITPALLPQIRTHAYSTHSRTFVFRFDDNDTAKLYTRISYTINTLLDCYNELILRPAIVSQSDLLLAGLLQLSHAPLAKVTEQNPKDADSSSDFVMTTELYAKLKEEQNDFLQKLKNLVENYPQTLLIKELMVILGIKNPPKWLKISITRYLTDIIMQDNGVATLTLAICDEISDLGKCWEKLDVAARLVVMSHGSNVENYYNSICSQIIDLLNSKDNRHGIIIAKCCIKALFDYNLDVFRKKIFRKIAEPLLLDFNNQENASGILRTEDEVSQCVENLSELFLTTDAEFRCVNSRELTDVTLSLFYLYIISHNSVYVLRKNVRELLLKILEIQSVRDNTFAIMLNHKEFEQKKLSFSFGPKGGLQIIANPTDISQELLAECLLDLVVKHEQPSFDLFIYLLKVVPTLNDAVQEAQSGKLLVCDEDIFHRIEKKIIAITLLTKLSGSSLVQKAQMKNPEPLLNFIKFLFTKLHNNAKDKHTTSYESDLDTLYTGLMLVKVILTDGNVGQTWGTYQNFITSIKQQFEFQQMSQVVSLIDEIDTIIKKRGKAYSSYCDLSADNKNISEFDKAIANLTDPLLPVRAHGIVALTKLIERRHPDVTLKKDFLLCLFEKNLSHDDSFIYLAAINGVCAMSSMFADKVIEILVREFIGMTQQTEDRNIAPETRAKLGEILVKTTRDLGEMTPKYKTLLVNGFLCGTKDPDPMVRASSLSCLGEFCKIMGFRLGNLIVEILYCIGCIIKTDKDDACRRAGVLVATLLLRGLGKDALTQLGENLVPLYRSLKHLRDNDKDPVLQLHAQLALEEFNDIVQQFLFASPKLEKSIFLLS